MESERAALVWRRLAENGSLEDLGLPSVDGRVSVRGLATPNPATLQQYTTAFAHVAELDGVVTLRSAHLVGVDFSNTQLAGLRLVDSEIENCRFDGAVCRDWKMWGTRFARCSFRHVDFRGAAFGGVGESGRRNVYELVDFAEADMRKTVHASALMSDCMFHDTRLAGVDFQGTVFRNCEFAGTLEGVLFYRSAFRGEGQPPNEMAGVDFRNALLRDVEFRGLDLNQGVKWPDNDDLIIVDRYKEVLEAWIEQLSEIQPPARSLSAVAKMMLRWAGTNQVVGVVSKADLLALGGGSAVESFMSAVRAVRS